MNPRPGGARASGQAPDTATRPATVYIAMALTGTGCEEVRVIDANILNRTTLDLQLAEVELCHRGEAAAAMAPVTLLSVPRGDLAPGETLTVRAIVVLAGLEAPWVRSASVTLD